MSVRELERALARARQRAGLDRAFERARDEHRVGRFHVPDELVRQRPDVAQVLLARTLIIDAAFDYLHRAIRYTAYSPDFPVARPEGEPPTYDLHRELLELPDGEVRLVGLRFAVDGPATQTVSAEAP